MTSTDGEENIPLSLFKQSVLSILGNSPTYPSTYFSLIPPRIRLIVAFNLPAYDLHRVIQDDPSFLDGLWNIEEDELWKRRYSTTLVKFSNVWNFELDIETHALNKELSPLWKDRYLTASLLNIPKSTTRGLPWGVIPFSMTDITFSDGLVYRESINTTKHALQCLAGRDGKAESCHFVSIHRLNMLEHVPPFNRAVGTKWPLSERLEICKELFPGWNPYYIPIQYDQQSSPAISHHLDEVKQLVVYSGWYEVLSYAEISENDERPINLPDCFIKFIQCHSKSLETVILFAPAMQKCPDGELIPLSITSSTLTQAVVSNVPSLKHLSISMKNNEIRSLDILPSLMPSMYDHLETLLLKINRPTYSSISPDHFAVALSDLYKNSLCFRDLILQGLLFDGRNFVQLMLSFFNTKLSHQGPPQSLVLRNVKIKTDELQLPDLDQQLMPLECRYMKSLYIHRLINPQSFYHAISAYKDIFLDTFSYSSTIENFFFPEHVTLHANTVSIEKIRIPADNMDPLRCALSTDAVKAVRLSLGEVHPISQAVSVYNDSIKICSSNLKYLDFKNCLVHIPSMNKLEAILVAIFTLPSLTLANLELNPIGMMHAFYTSMATEQSLHQPHIVFRRSPHRKIFDNLSAKIELECWTLLHRIWLREAGNVKLKAIHVSLLALGELEHKLEELSCKINTTS
jgi:hypothetical protein